MASSWSSRSPPMAPSTTTATPPAPTAISTASSVSDASLSAGWRSTLLPEAANRATSGGSIESRSPTRTSGVRPTRSSEAAPPSAAMTRSASSSHVTSDASSSPDATTTTFIGPSCSMRCVDSETTNGATGRRAPGRAAARAASTSFAGMTRIRFEGLRTHRRPHSQRCGAPLSFPGCPIRLARAL